MSGNLFPRKTTDYWNTKTKDGFISTESVVLFGILNNVCLVTKRQNYPFLIFWRGIWVGSSPKWPVKSSVLFFLPFSYETENSIFLIFWFLSFRTELGDKTQGNVGFYITKVTIIAAFFFSHCFVSFRIVRRKGLIFSVFAYRYRAPCR